MAGHDRATPCPTPPTIENTEPEASSQEANLSNPLGYPQSSDDAQGQGEPSLLQPDSQLENLSKDDNSSGNGGENSLVGSSKRKRVDSVSTADGERPSEEKEKLSEDKSSEDNPSKKKKKSDDDDNSSGGGENSGGGFSGPSNNPGAGTFGGENSAGGPNGGGSSLFEIFISGLLGGISVIAETINNIYF